MESEDEAAFKDAEDRRTVQRLADMIARVPREIPPPRRPQKVSKQALQDLEHEFMFPPILKKGKDTRSLLYKVRVGCCYSLTCIVYDNLHFYVIKLMALV